MAFDRLAFMDTETCSLEASYDVTRNFWMAGIACVDGVEILDDITIVAAKVRDLLSDGYDFVFANASFDVAVLRLRGVDIPEGRYHDVQLMHYLLAPSDASNHSLETMSMLYLGRGKLPSPDFSAPSQAMRDYLAIDVENTRDIFPFVLEQLEDDEDLLYYYLDVALPYVEVLIDMQQSGVYIERSLLEDSTCKWRKHLEKISWEFRAEAGYRRGRVMTGSKTLPFGRGRCTTILDDGSYSHCTLDWLSPTSLKDVTEVLTSFDDFKPIKISPKTGLPVLDSTTLSAYADEYAVAEIIQRHRMAHKFYTAFLAPISRRTAENPVLHCLFNPINTRTTRKSCSSPNLQQIPARDARGAEMRRMFQRRDENHILVVGDLDRIEVCVFAFYLEYMFGFTALANAVRNKEDVHAVNAERWNCPRFAAKTGIFLLIYGGGVSKLSQSCDLSMYEARRVYKAMHRDMPIEEYQEACFAEARENHGYLRGLFGDRYYIPEVLSNNKNEQASGRRKCGNYRIQGTAGSVFDILQIEAMPTVRRLKGHQLLAVHDESVYEFPIHVGEEAASRLTEVYSQGDLLSVGNVHVPVTAEFHVGHDWYTAKEGGV